MDYTYFYIEANIVCIVIFGMMLMRELHTVGRQAKQIAFLNLLVSHILYFISDIAWVLVVGGIIPNTRLSSSIVNVANAVFLVYICSFWFIYVELSQGEAYIAVKKWRIMVLIPAIISSAVTICLFVFAPSLMLKENNEVTDIYNVAFLLIPDSYVVVSAVRAFIRALRKENYAVRTQYLACAVYPILITIFGLLQTVMNGAPVFCFGCAVMMLYVYILSLNDQVSLDELTRLNNRTQLKKYIAGEAAKQIGEKQERYVLMIDLNKFKMINDHYGHIEGDYALKRAADALKSACADNVYKTFIARYGGDEFIIVAKTDSEELIKKLCADIKATLIRLNDEAGAKYDLTASIGYAHYNGGIDEFQSAMSEADEALYRDKKAAG
jgi:diguanylate cyclase (GGDEF)-like protein